MSPRPSSDSGQGYRLGRAEFPPSRATKSPSWIFIEDVIGGEQSLAEAVIDAADGPGDSVARFLPDSQMSGSSRRSRKGPAQHRCAKSAAPVMTPGPSAAAMRRSTETSSRAFEGVDISRSIVCDRIRWRQRLGGVLNYYSRVA
jgi:hypothetical protein